MTNVDGIYDEVAGRRVWRRWAATVATSMGGAADRWTWPGSALGHRTVTARSRFGRANRPQSSAGGGGARPPPTRKTVLVAVPVRAERVRRRAETSGSHGRW